MNVQRKKVFLHSPYVYEEYIWGNWIPLWQKCAFESFRCVLGWLFNSLLFNPISYSGEIAVLLPTIFQFALALMIRDFQEILIKSTEPMKECIQTFIA